MPKTIEPIQPKKIRQEFWVCYEHKGARGIHAKVATREMTDASIDSCKRWLDRVNEAAGLAAVPYEIWIQEYVDGALVRNEECEGQSSSKESAAENPPPAGKKRTNTLSTASA